MGRMDISGRASGLRELMCKHSDKGACLCFRGSEEGNVAGTDEEEREE